jgi:hypothetical protein
MIQVTPADPDTTLKAELRSQWIEHHPDLAAAVAAVANAEAAAQAPTWNADPLVFISNAKAARTAVERARANVATVRAQLGAADDNAVRVAPVSINILSLRGSAAGAVANMMHLSHAP